LLKQFKTIIVYYSISNYLKRANKLTAENIFLVGPMGSGKTTIGRTLAGILNFKFFDLDSEIEKRCGANIPWIFDVEGENGFRERESRILEELSSSTGMVLATGGGAVIRKKNREILKKNGYVVYLNAPIERLVERTSHDHNRPLLQVENPREAIEKMILERESFYQDVANFVLITDKKRPRLVANEIACEVRKFIL
jgi:shikimate kinase